jgi:hypothetical protein
VLLLPKVACNLPFLWPYGSLFWSDASTTTLLDDLGVILIDRGSPKISICLKLARITSILFFASRTRKRACSDREHRYYTIVAAMCSLFWWTHLYLFQVNQQVNHPTDPSGRAGTASSTRKTKHPCPKIARCRPSSCRFEFNPKTSI